MGGVRGWSRVRNLCCQLPHASSASGDNRTGPTMRQSGAEGRHFQRTRSRTERRNCECYEHNLFLSPPRSTEQGNQKVCAAVLRRAPP